MDTLNLRLEKRPPLAVVTLDRPEVLNALDAATLTEIDATLDDLAADPAIRVVLVTGAGDRAFAAGADLHQLAPLAADAGRALALRGQGIFRKLEMLDKPVIACINGFALGGGCELAMACTFRLAADHARLGQPEVKLGLTCGYGGTQRLPRLVGRGAALKLLLTGAVIDAHEAFRIGLVDEVVSAPQLMQRAQALAREIAGNAPLAIAETIRAVDEGLDLPLEGALDREAACFGHLCGTADKAEGIEAFLTKRPAVWTGR